MQFVLNEEQQMLVDGVTRLVNRYGGSERARAITGQASSDNELLHELSEHGFLGVATDPLAGPLEAILVVDAVTAGLGTCPVGTLAVVAPLASGSGLKHPVVPAPVLATSQQLERDVPLRWATEGADMLVWDSDQVIRHTIHRVEPVDRGFGFPLARVESDSRGEEPDIDPARLASWWRVSVSAELVSCASKALGLTLEHTRERVQFGRSLASFQALQHRLAQLLVTVEGARWLTYATAWDGAPRSRSLLCAAHAVRAGRLAIRECHQLCGALGLTLEFDLQLWTMRISDLCAELGGPGSLLSNDGPSWTDVEF